MATNSVVLLIFAHFSTFLAPFPSQPKNGDFIRPSPVDTPFLPYRPIAVPTYTPDSWCQTDTGIYAIYFSVFPNAICTSAQSVGNLLIFKKRRVEPWEEGGYS